MIHYTKLRYFHEVHKICDSQPMTMETRLLPKKRSNFSDTRRKISVPLAMSTHLPKKTSKLSKKRKKSFLIRSWAKIGLRKTQPNVNSKRRDSESWTDIDRQKPTTAP